jgi:predicted nucleic acid-binding protein
MEFLKNAILIDTSAIIALHNTEDQFHSSAKKFFEEKSNDILWVVINSTKHESYTRFRYDFSFDKAISVYDFLSDDLICQIRFTENDEAETLKLLKKYKSEKLSFHDALCASIMMRIGIYRVFTFDSDFLYFGFDILPLYKGLG